VRGQRTTITILMADDDEDDCLLAREALAESRLANELRFVKDGEELMDYLHQRGEYVQKLNSPRPGLILLDLNMPKKDGREVLKEIKTDPNLRQIPVVVLTTSKAEEDIYKIYDLGANSFITKPVTFSSLVEVMKTIGKYWFEIVELPLEGVGERHEQRPS
jgi:CheY-like chemotaxis protein